MGLLDNYKINRAIHAFLAAPEATDAEAVQAMKTLQGCGAAAIPKLLEACAKTRPPEPFVKLLRTFVRDETLALYGEGLASSNTRMVTVAADVLAHSTSYNPNLLLDFFIAPRFPKGIVGKLLKARVQALSVKALLQASDKVTPKDRSALLELLPEIVTATDVPLLLQRLDNADEQMRLACLRTALYFPSDLVRAACYKLLSDPLPFVRITALEGLERLQLPLDLKRVCQALCDPHDGVRSEAKKLLGRCRDPQLVPCLFDILEDKASEAHADAAALLGMVYDAGTIQKVVATRPHPVVTRNVLLHLLEASQAKTRHVALLGLATVESTFDIEIICPLLWDADGQVRQLAGIILTQYRVPQTLETLCRALKDPSSSVHQNAITILNVIATPHIVQELLRAFHNEDPALTTRLITALGDTGGSQVIKAALQLVAEEDPLLRAHIHEILRRTHDAAVVTFLSDTLRRAKPWGRKCAAEVLGMLGERGRDAVPALVDMAQASADEALAAIPALTKIGDPRAITVCLTHMQHGTPALQKLALDALTVLTDGAHFDGVLRHMLALRDTVPAGSKEPFNQAAAALLRRFSDRVVSKEIPNPLSGSLSLETSSASAVQPRSLGAEPLAGLVVSKAFQERLEKLAASTSASQVTPGTVSGTWSQASQRLSGTGGGGTGNSVAGRSGAQDAPERTGNGEMDARTMLPGDILGGRYEVMKYIGEGGFGTVVLAKDQVIQEELILKFLHPQVASDERMIRRFIHELRYARRVTHENVIRIHDFLQFDGVYAISMEYFPGHNLGVEIDAKRFLTDVPRGLRVLARVCRGMHSAHQANIIHRDLKPANILLNNRGTVKIVDFGLASAVTDKGTKLTRSGAMLGTPLYMSPEQARNQPLDARSDVYSLGVIMYEMFTGQVPYMGTDPLSVLFQHVEGQLTPPCTLNPMLMPEIEAIILHAMAVDPEQRLQSMEAFEKRIHVLRVRQG